MFLGWLLTLAGLASGVLPLTATGAGIAVLGAQALLWTGELGGYPRKRAAAIISSVLGGLLFVILVGIRLYAGPEAWSG